MEKISPIKERVLQYIKYKKITKQKFCKTTGISYGNMKGISLKSELGGGQISSILECFSEISPDWLVMGKGEMLRNGDEKAEKNSGTLPLIPFDALAGLPAMDNIGVTFLECEQYHVPEFVTRGAEFLIRVSGSSMYPKYSNGDILACRRISEIMFFQWGKVYVLDTSQGILVKRVQKSDDPDCVTLVSDNAGRYAPFDIPKADIRSLSIVIGVIRME